MEHHVQSFSVDGDATIRTKDPFYMNTIGQRQNPSFNDVKLLNMMYCSGACPAPGPTCTNDGYDNPNACGTCLCPSGLTGDCTQLAPSSRFHLPSNVVDFQRPPH